MEVIFNNNEVAASAENSVSDIPANREIKGTVISSVKGTVTVESEGKKIILKTGSDIPAGTEVNLLRKGNTITIYVGRNTGAAFSDSLLLSKSDILLKLDELSLLFEESADAEKKSAAALISSLKEIISANNSFFTSSIPKTLKNHINDLLLKIAQLVDKSGFSEEAKKEVANVLKKTASSLSLLFSTSEKNIQIRPEAGTVIKAGTVFEAAVSPDKERSGFVLEVKNTPPGMPKNIFVPGENDILKNVKSIVLKVLKDPGGSVVMLPSAEDGGLEQRALEFLGTMNIENSRETTEVLKQLMQLSDIRIDRNVAGVFLKTLESLKKNGMLIDNPE
ncbi:MAG: hypothetical protein ACLFQK_07490, partial [Fibrobacterota bacterium]